MKQHGDVTDYIEFGDKLVGKNLCTKKQASKKKKILETKNLSILKIKQETKLEICSICATRVSASVAWICLIADYQSKGYRWHFIRRR